jgi:hypothetical protein
MKNALIASIFVLISVIGFQACIDRNAGGVSASNLLLYSTTTVEEESGNDGTFNGEIEVTVKGTTFGSSFVDGVDYGSINVPDGLTVTFERVSDTKGLISITGQADSHSGCGDGAVVSFYFASSAFEDEKLPLSFEVPIRLKFIKPVLTYSTTTLSEVNANNGSFTQSITITASGGGSFANVGPMLAGTDYEWDLPGSLVPTLTASDTDADLNADTVTAILTGSADDHTPIDDITTTLKFLSPGLTSEFCAAEQKKDISLKFYRSILMYSVGASSGNLNGRTGADGLCSSGRPSGLPSDYTGFRAFISVDNADEIADMPANYSVPTSVNIESLSSILVKNSWTDLLNDGTIDNDLDSADIVNAGSDYWTGSAPDGQISSTCGNWGSSSSGSFGQVGLDSAVDGTWIDNGTQTCNTPANVLCLAFVE